MKGLFYNKLCSIVGYFFKKKRAPRNLGGLSGVSKPEVKLVVSWF
jgi:hypothetical protein